MFMPEADLNLKNMAFYNRFEFLQKDGVY